MEVWALAAALAALGLAGAALISVARLRRQVARWRRSGRLVDDEMLREAWLEEIETRGQAVLSRIAAAQDGLARAEAGAHERSMGLPPGTPLAPAGPQPGDPPQNRDPAGSVAGGEPRGRGDASAPPAADQRDVRAYSADGLAPRVRALAAQGLDPTAIARQLGVGRGEVELILNLSEPDRG